MPEGYRIKATRKKGMSAPREKFYLFNRRYRTEAGAKKGLTAFHKSLKDKLYFFPVKAYDYEIVADKPKREQ